MAYDYDYDYYSDIIDDVIDDAIVDSIEEERKAIRQQAGAADYSGVVGGIADAIGSGIGNIYSDYAGAIGPSVTGYYGDDYSGYDTSELYASNTGGVSDTYDYGATDDYGYNLLSDEGVAAAYAEAASDSPYSDIYGGDLTLQQLLNLAATVPQDEYTRLTTEYYNKNYPVNEPSADDINALFNTEDDYGYGYSDEDVAAYIASLGSNGTETEGGGTETEGGGAQTEEEKAGFFSSLLAAMGLGGLGQGGLGGALGTFIGSLLGGKGKGGGFGTGNPLLDFLMMKSLMKDDKQGYVPVGGEAYGGQAFNYQDYQPTNLQPALMPGVAYANVGAPGMMGGGEAKGIESLSEDNRPGDITFAKLEPGEFVIRREAVDAVGIPTLEQINSMGG